MRSIYLASYIRGIIGLYWGYIGMMERKMANTGNMGVT